MRGGRLSSKQGRIHKVVGGSMDIDKVDKVKEEPQLSGAYIRSLVKHLTSTRSKDPIDGDGGLTKSQNRNEECLSDVNNPPQQQQEPSPPTTQPPQHKKQVRRRLHTTRPYQERLLNMAEARREIVTALKFHRASMKQEASTNHDLQSPQTHPLQQEQSPPPPPQPCLGKSKSRRNSILYPSTATVTTAAVTNTNISNNFLDPYASLSYPPPPPYHWPMSTIAPPPPPLYYDDLNFSLPNQTLGLNLNFQNFNNLDTNIYHNPMSMYSSSSTSSSPSTSSSAAISVATEEAVVAKPKQAVVMNGGIGDGLYHAMDDEEMEEIRCLGEQHQMEWNDTINLVTSARWCKFLKSMETGAEEGKCSSAYGEDAFDGFQHFDEVTEFPSWLMNANESSSGLQQHFPDDACLQDPALPCMDIGEIEGIDGEWLA